MHSRPLLWYIFFSILLLQFYSHWSRTSVNTCHIMREFCLCYFRFNRRKKERCCNFQQSCMIEVVSCGLSVSNFLGTTSFYLWSNYKTTPGYWYNWDLYVKLCRMVIIFLSFIHSFKFFIFHKNVCTLH